MIASGFHRILALALGLGAASALLAQTPTANADEVAAAAARVGAFALARESKDAALLIALPAGSYSAQVSGAAGTTGVALVEVYEIP